jgi:hypothetical protein
MEVKEAVKMAKEHIVDLYEAESIINLGLEEVVLEDGVWRITIGFSRPWDIESDNLFVTRTSPKRTYKVVAIDGTDGRIMSVISHRADISH